MNSCSENKNVKRSCQGYVTDLCKYSNETKIIQKRLTLAEQKQIFVPDQEKVLSNQYQERSMYSNGEHPQNFLKME